MNINKLFFVCIMLIFASCKTETPKIETNFVDKTDATNDFYDNEELHLLQGSEIMISGEIEKPGIVDFKNFPERSIIVKEALLDSNKTKFIGAYKYTGYSLYDILNRRILQKKNADIFPPIVDLYVEIENDNGEKVIISWGELYYPIHRHEIIIATKVMHIVPSKTKDYWPLPTETRLIVGSDLLTERNISNPSKITIKSLDRNYTINREINPMYSPDLKFFVGEKLIQTITELPENTKYTDYPNIFYGRGRGIHGVSPFNGAFMKDVFKEYFEVNKENLQTGMFTVAAVDGYRAAYTFSEVFNRNDQSEVLIIDKDNYEDAGKFSLYPAGDFFSDRAIKAVNEIRFEHK